jgi:hypothetical protein
MEDGYVATDGGSEIVKSGEDAPTSDDPFAAGQVIQNIDSEVRVATVDSREGSGRKERDWQVHVDVDQPVQQAPV